MRRLDLKRAVQSNHEAPGAWPNGSRIIKTRDHPSDTHPPGALGTVLASMGPAPGNFYGYFVAWDSEPDVHVFISSTAIALAPEAE